MSRVLRSNAPVSIEQVPGRSRLSTQRGNQLAAIGRISPLVGSLLRHESLKTTALYAKVDAQMLQELAQPWIGGNAK